MALSGSFFIYSCEAEADDLGAQFFDQTAAQGTRQSYDITAYNISNADTIRTDASRISTANIGAFREGVFGTQKVHHVSQARLSSYNPDFGTNPVVDSVVLELRPLYPADSSKVTTDENYIFPDGNVPAKKVVTTYPINVYGRDEAQITLNVHEVDEFLGAASDPVYSNRQVTTSTLLGSKKISSKVSSIKVTKDSDNTDLFTRDARLRIPLDKTFFQNKIIAKKGQSELSDAASFIRYFKGIRISTVENDGFIMQFSPAETQIVVYYKRDVTANGTTTATPATFAISLGSGNAKFSQIEFDRSGTPSQAVIENLSDNVQSGDPLLYVQGMGGPSLGVRIPASTVAQLRELFKTKQINILSAKVRLFSDPTWSEAFEKPSGFVASPYDPNLRKMNLSEFLKDLSAFTPLNSQFKLVQGYDLTKTSAYYDLTITQTLKDVIEKSETIGDIALSVGSYEINASTGNYVGPSATTRAYTPHRILLVGSDGSSRRSQLQIIYSSKKL